MKLVAKSHLKKKNETKVEIHLYPDVFKWKKESESDDSLYCDNFPFNFILFSFQYSSILFNLITWKLLQASFLSHLLSLYSKPLGLLLLGKWWAFSWLVQLSEESFSPGSHTYFQSRAKPSQSWLLQERKRNHMTASSWFPLTPISCFWFSLKEAVP